MKNTPFLSVNVAFVESFNKKTATPSIGSLVSLSITFPVMILACDGAIMKKIDNIVRTSLIDMFVRLNWLRN